MTHPLEDEDLHVEINHVADSPSVTVAVTHIPTGFSASGVGTDEDIVRRQAMDDLLEMLETISG